MTNFVSLMKALAASADEDDVMTVRTTLTRLLPTLTTKAEHQKAYTALEHTAMTTPNPRSRRAALAAIKVASRGELASR